MRLRFAACLAVVCAAPAWADQPDPVADTSLVEACLENVSIAREDGVDMTDADCIGVAASACMEQPGGESTAGMVDCTGQEYDFWDGMLNDSYQALMARGEDWDPSTIPGGSAEIAPNMLVTKMQRDWIAYRNSSCMWQSRPWDGGTIVNVAHAGCMLDQVAAQALRLRGMLAFERELGG